MKHSADREKPVSIRLTLVVDDHPLYCDAMAASLKSLFDVGQVRTVNSLREAVAALAGGMVPDLVMLDLKLPDVTGLSGFLKLKEMLPDVPILIISADSCDDTIQALMDAGAVGFIPKDAPRTVIAEALERVQDGSKYLPPGFVPQARPDRYNVELKEISKRIADLTPQQSRIMSLICAGKPNKQIAYELSLAEATVKAHITALLRRLGVRNRTQAAVLVNSVAFDRQDAPGDGNPGALLS
ncbi:response regulator transcription factor [Sulfitobacter sp. D35]|uniref:response regulator transcription factor n=1 Tax=Sulfitobacter sp. D35 TaxID=3083252 RepID=UPI00296F7B8E|nr:response regulator transcription factor [Sulfitobacter sp. D35]MDW4498642.1 response regulator transcription factor [Sulfitobacter sp. D35]